MVEGTVKESVICHVPYRFVCRSLSGLANRRRLPFRTQRSKSRVALKFYFSPYGGVGE